MKRKLLPVITLIGALLLPQSALAWNDTGHKLVARIAWENMTPTARKNVIELLKQAPPDACLLDLLHDPSSPDGERAFFVQVATWPDIVRPRDKKDKKDDRPCIKFHHGDWHFINFFWKGTSGETGANRPQDVSNIPVPNPNAIVQLTLFRPSVFCNTPPCSTPAAERAVQLAWILHLVGDIHQPLHTSARVTRRKAERQGDRGGNLFEIGKGTNPPVLHSYWDGIIDRSVQRQESETDLAYIERVANMIMTQHPRASLSSRILPIDFDAWAREGFATTKQSVYPKTLQRGIMPDDTYRQNAFVIAQAAIALGGYRLAELLNQVFDS